MARSVPGMVFTSTFDELLPRYNWGEVWARDAGAVAESIAPEGLQGSNALLVRSASARDWAISTSFQLEVSPGDTFDFTGYARTTADASAQMGVTLYDAHDEVTKWNDASITIRGASWQLYTNRFVAPEGTARVRFRLAGSGIGECSFDDVTFIRVR